MLKFAFPTAHRNHGTERVVVDTRGDAVLRLIPSGEAADEVVVTDPFGAEICRAGRRGPCALHYGVFVDGRSWAQIQSKGIFRVRSWISFTEGTRLDLEGDLDAPDISLLSDGTECARLIRADVKPSDRVVEVYGSEDDAISLVIVAVALDADGARNPSYRQGASLDAAAAVSRQLPADQQRQRNAEHTSRMHRQLHSQSMATHRRATDVSRQSFDRMTRGY